MSLHLSLYLSLHLHLRMRMRMRMLRLLLINPNRNSRQALNSAESFFDCGGVVGEGDYGGEHDDDFLGGLRGGWDEGMGDV